MLSCSAAATCSTSGSSEVTSRPKVLSPDLQVWTYYPGEAASWHNEALPSGGTSRTCAADIRTNGIHTHPSGPQLNLHLRSSVLLGATLLVAGLAAAPTAAPLALAAGEGTVAPALVPALAPPVSVVDRIAGNDRFATAVAASVSTFPATASAVVLASGNSFPDALVG